MDIEAFVEIVRGALALHSSPTIDRGDSHGARNQGGYIVYANGVGGLAQAIFEEMVGGRAPPERLSDVLRAELRAKLASRGVIFKAPAGEEPPEFFLMGCGFLLGENEELRAARKP